MQRSTSNVQHPTLNAATKPARLLERPQAYDLEDRLLRYAASVVRLVRLIPSDRCGNHVAGQLLRSGTSPLPNHGEAQAAESPADFIHKMRVCLKELRESRRWLRLIKEIPLLEQHAEVDRLIDETEQLVRIFVASIRTTKSKSVVTEKSK
jgi:four helix bundle protein